MTDTMTSSTCSATDWAPDVSTEGGLASLGRTLEWGIDQRLQTTRSTLRAWVRDAVNRAALQTEMTDPRGQRRRRVMTALKLSSHAAAEMLITLLDQPDVPHDHAMLAGGPITDGGVSQHVKSLIRVRIWQLRSRLMIHGLGDTIRSRHGRGYFVTGDDASRINRLWDGR